MINANIINNRANKKLIATEGTIDNYFDLFLDFSPPYPYPYLLFWVSLFV